MIRDFLSSILCFRALSSQGIAQVFSWPSDPQALPKATSMSSQGSVTFGSLDFSMTSHQHPLLCIMQSTVPAGEGNWILFCVRCMFCWFFLIHPELISPPWVLNTSSEWYLGCFTGRSSNSGGFFSGNRSSLLIKSILNLCDSLKYHLHV